MIHAAHFLLYSHDADADRRFFAETLDWPAVDAGHGWLIMACPPSELGVHPFMGDESAPDGLAPVQLYLISDDIKADVKLMKSRKVPCTKPENQGFGIVSIVTLPSGGRIGLYEPRHPLAAGKKPKRRTTAASTATSKTAATTPKKT